MVGKPRVLVVDDDPDKLSLLQFALSRAGYEVRAARDGDEGYGAVTSFDPDLVVSDIMMPGMNGYELARRIRENPQTRFIPVILQTAAVTGAEDARLGSEVGALGYITDPLDLELLLARARTLLDFKTYLDNCEEQASTDHLTGLANRRRFERQLDREVARTARHGRPFCLVTLDIDNFKQVNDKYGHDAGDEALRALGRVLQEGTRGIDLAARIGGEEFAVILTETGLEAAIEVADRLRQAMKALDIQPFGQIAASFGVAECPTHAENGRDLLAIADAALYEAKRAGKDRIARAATPRSNSAEAVGVQ